MSTLTANYGLVKPDETDNCSIEVLNSNADIIDAKLHDLDNGKADKSEVEALKKLASDGKRIVANAVTAKGVTTATDATFETIANNIGSIKTNPALQIKSAALKTTAQTIKPDSGYDGLSSVSIPAIAGTSNVSDVLTGKTFSSAAGVNLTGTMVNNGAVYQTLNAGGSYTIPSGYHNGNGKVVVDSANTAKLNLFTQQTEPTIKDGIWVKTSNPHQRAIIDNRVISNNGVWGNTITDMPYEFILGELLLYKGEMHILGATNSNTSHYKWNGTSWVPVSTLPCKFFNGCAVVYNDEIHILGSGQGSVSYHYKWNGLTWELVSTMPYWFYSGGAVVYNNEIYIMGGTENPTKFHKWNGSSWEKLSNLSYDFYLGSAVVYNGEIHLLGTGYTNRGKGHYKWNGSSWVSASTLPYEFYRGDAVVYGGELHILGGQGADTNHYKWNGTSWVSVSTMPINFESGRAVVENDSIHIVVGKKRVKFTTPTNIYSPYTLIIQRGDTHKGVYLTAIADTSAIMGGNNRFVSAFDDVWYYGASGFEMGDAMYYGNGTSWVRFKN